MGWPGVFVGSGRKGFIAEVALEVDFGRGVLFSTWLGRA